MWGDNLPTNYSDPYGTACSVKSPSTSIVTGVTHTGLSMLTVGAKPEINPEPAKNLDPESVPLKYALKNTLVFVFADPK